MNSSHYWYVCKFLKFAMSVVTCSVYCEKTTFITLVSTVFLLHGVKIFLRLQFKGEKILKGSKDSISSPSRSHEHLNFCFYFFRQNIAGCYQQTFCPKGLLTAPNNVLPLHPKPTFPPIIWIFTEGDGIESRLSS